MGKFWRLLAEYDAETTTYTACVGPKGSSPYTPDVSGKLIGLRAIANRSAVTSLINHVQFRLSCTTFNPNSIECGCQGTGIQTAPAFQQAVFDFEVDQPVQAGVPITIEARNNTVDTPVTVSAMLYGMFAT
jgi:hypothetical protein